MSDGKTIPDCAIFKLSKEKGMEWFKHIIFFSSFQDSYSPVESARVQISTDVITDIKYGSAFIEMVSNILSPLRCDHLYRVSIHFKIKENSLDTFIGRTAHI